MAQSRRVPKCFGDGGLATKCESAPISTPVDHEELARIARALAHPARLAIISRFADREPKLTKDLVAPSGLAPSTMSEHLRILREAGLVVANRDGSGIWYCLCGERLADFSVAVGRLSCARRALRPDVGTFAPDDVRRIAKQSPQQIVN